jgi:GH25 family lysozyme M1 (1,4-beta-N-acetylmuramidase)
MMKGIDVSYVQGEQNFDYALAKQCGKDFAVVRLSQGRHDGSIYKDDYFEYNINAALDTGMFAGVYHFLGSLNPDDAVKEAQSFIEIYNQLVSPGVTDVVGVWLDVEAEPGQAIDNLDMETLTDTVFAFILECNKAGINCGIYANYNYFTSHIDTSKFANYVKLWISEPDVRNYYQEENPMKPIKMWQYSFTGNICGVEVDEDIMYEDGDE